MLSLISLFVASLLLALIVTPPVRSLALQLGWMDRPDNDRHLHSKAVPRVGGISIVICFLGSLGLLALLSGPSGVDKSVHTLLLSIGPAAAIVFVIGLLDDIYTLAPRKKLAGQALAAFLAWWAGLRVQTLGSVALEEWQGFFLTVLWLIGCSNAFNLIDGLDGLATGTGAIAAAAIVVAALLNGNIVLAFGAAPLMGALIGFLRYNFSPASIFLGDCGSLPIGFLLGVFAVLWSQQAQSFLALLAPLMALALPLADTGIALFRRLVRGQSIFSADRNHIHHRMISLGLAPQRTVLVLYFSSASAAALAVLQSAGDSRQQILALFAFSLAVWTGICCLRYTEFTVMRSLLFGREEKVGHSLRALGLSLATHDRSGRILRPKVGVLGERAIQAGSLSYRSVSPWASAENRRGQMSLCADLIPHSPEFDNEASYEDLGALAQSLKIDATHPIKKHPAALPEGLSPQQKPKTISTPAESRL